MKSAIVTLSLFAGSMLHGTGAMAEDSTTTGEQAARFENVSMTRPALTRETPTAEVLVARIKDRYRTIGSGSRITVMNNQTSSYHGDDAAPLHARSIQIAYERGADLRIELISNAVLNQDEDPVRQIETWREPQSITVRKGREFRGQDYRRHEGRHVLASAYRADVTGIPDDIAEKLFGQFATLGLFDLMLKEGMQVQRRFISRSEERYILSTVRPTATNAQTSMEASFELDPQSDLVVRMFATLRQNNPDGTTIRTEFASQIDYVMDVDLPDALFVIDLPDWHEDRTETYQQHADIYLEWEKQQLGKDDEPTEKSN